MKKKLLICLILTMLPFLLFAESYAVLEYFEDPSMDFYVVDDTGYDLYPDFGIELFPGYKIETGSGSAEIRLDPNGSILKLSPGTVFVIDSLQGASGAESNAFSILSGKLRTVAASASGKDVYTINTPTAVCGVRGTDVLNDADTGDTTVKFGKVEMIKPGETTGVLLGQGQKLNTFADVFEAITLSQEELDAIYSSVEFQTLSPAAVPGKESHADEYGEEGTQGPTAASELGDDPLMRWLTDVLGMEFGTVTINNETWNKVVIQPIINAPELKLKAQLYVPIIYTDNLFDPDSWYKQAGNNEWTFGFDKLNQEIPLFDNFNPSKEGASYPEYVIPFLKDFWTDFWLKMKYFEYGDQAWDKFYLKMGNLHTMTLGHGMLMYNFANDEDFPAIRKIGINTGLTGKRLGLEAIMDDIAEPTIMGGRLTFRPFKGKSFLATSVSGVVDLKPGADITESVFDADDLRPETDDLATLDLTAAEYYGDPMFIGTSLDLELFELNTVMLKLLTYADLGLIVPYFRETGSDAVDKGINWNLFYNSSAEGLFEKFTNFGVSAGVRGKVLGLDLTVEALYYNGLYRPGFFDSVYTRRRAEYITKYYDYIRHADDATYLDEAGYTDYTLGVYGEGGFSAVQDKLLFSLGYMWPWTIEVDEDTNERSINMSADDKFSMRLDLLQGVIPGVDIGGGISYERAKFVETIQTLAGTNVEDLGPEILFDANTIFAGEIVYGIQEGINLVVSIKTAPTYDDNGAIVYTDMGIPAVTPVFTVETRLGGE